MNLSIEIDKSGQSDSPLYRQISEAIIRRIEDGTLTHGSRLPTVRELAGKLSVTRVTVHNAYTELKSRGWIDATVGKGTFVIGPPSSPLEIVETPSAPITRDKVMEDMTRLSRLTGARSLAMAEPDLRLHPVDSFARLLSNLMSGSNLFYYGSSQGDQQLRQELAALLAEKGIQAESDDILVTSGVTQGLSLVTAALCDRGDKVLVERPTYLGFLGLLESCGVEPISVPLDDEGPMLDELERVVVRERPRFFYTVPSFQNPTGVCMSEDRRRQLLSLAAEYGLVLVEDDIYGRLDYDAPPPRPLKANDDNDLVLHLDSFSKVLLPGLRVGFVVAPPVLREKLLSMFRVRELCGPPLFQKALAEFLRRGLFHQHLNQVIPIYRKRRDALLQALEQAMPDGVEWTVPRGGYCCWVSLPINSDFSELYRAALSRGVAYTPGEVFLTNPEARHHFRLCFGAHQETHTREAIFVLGDIIKDITSRQSVLPIRSLEPKTIV